jgi:hypothetical protein
MPEHDEFSGPVEGARAGIIEALGGAHATPHQVRRVPVTIKTGSTFQAKKYDRDTVEMVLPEEASNMVAHGVSFRTFEQDKAMLESYGYKLVTLAEFDAATDVPAGTTREVVRRLVAKHPGLTHVVYDPDNDDQGWLLVGEPAEIARDTAQHCDDVVSSTEPSTQDSLF